MITRSSPTPSTTPASRPFARVRRSVQPSGLAGLHRALVAAVTDGLAPAQQVGPAAAEPSGPVRSFGRIVTAAGNETPGSDPGAGSHFGGSGSEGFGRRSEGDLLAERRARRAAESGEQALARRADAAEATVRTLEAHVASLQERLREAGEERESRAEIEQLRRALTASENDLATVSARLETVRQELSEAEDTAARERADMRRAERDLQARLTELERQAFEIHRGLDAERAARERSERLLENMRRGQQVVESLVVELRALAARLTGAAPPSAGQGAASQPVSTQPPLAVPSPRVEEREPTPDLTQPEPDRTEMADALAAAVARLRARAQEQTEELPESAALGDPAESAAEPAERRLGASE